MWSEPSVPSGCSKDAAGHTLEAGAELESRTSVSVGFSAVVKIYTNGPSADAVPGTVAVAVAVPDAAAVAAAVAVVVVVAVGLLVATTLRSLALFHFLTLPPIDLLSRLNHPETPPPQPLILFRRLSSKGGLTFHELENETKGKK
uniref:Uncharacterized protein n=1 Tax=Vespula pensylvanica TaxID=30213 RepID=A0A834UA20_VESPE|nr:hypothetical protein H0235_007669 [Vespula pensylvanica]